MRAAARVTARVAFAVSAASLLAVAACSFGLDLDSLSSGCRDCVDATSERTTSDSSAADAGPAAADSSAGAADARPDAAACPGLHGPIMIAVQLDGGAQCVDRTEVTNAQYVEFIEAGAPNAALASCGDASLVPQAGWPFGPGQQREPVASVTWCGAQAFCRWAGKSLCGAKGGGELDVARIGDPKLDAWFAVCSHDGLTAYPYGDGYSAQACNGGGNVPVGPAPVASFSACTTAPGGEGPFDMSGNVWEWLDACGADGRCAAHGGGFNSPPDELRCNFAPLYAARDASQPNLGFRCCSP